MVYWWKYARLNWWSLTNWSTHHHYQQIINPSVYPPVTKNQSRFLNHQLLFSKCFFCALKQDSSNLLPFLNVLNICTMHKQSKWLSWMNIYLVLNVIRVFAVKSGILLVILRTWHHQKNYFWCILCSWCICITCHTNVYMSSHS